MSEPFEDRNLTLLRHDLANILMTVRGYAELMLVRDNLDPALRRYPEQIILAIDRASRDLDQLRTFSQENRNFLSATQRASGA